MSQLLMRSSLNSTKVDSSKCPWVISFPSPFIMDRGSRRTSLYSVGAQNNCACMKIMSDLSLLYPRWNIPKGKIKYSPVLLRHSLSNWWTHFFLDVERNLFSLKQVMHVGANNSPLLLFCHKLNGQTDSSFHPLQVAHQDSYPRPEQVAHQECLVDSCWQIFPSGTCVPLVVP